MTTSVPTGIDVCKRVCLALTLLLVTALPALGQAQLSTDLPDYPPGATVILTGIGFAPDEVVIVHVTHIDGIPNIGPAHEPWPVSADTTGAFTTTWTVDPDAVYSTLMATAEGQTSLLEAFCLFTDAPCVGAANLDQARNGSAASPVNPVDFQNGNLGQSNSHYVEGQSAAYRAVLTDLPIGETLTVTLEYDVKHSGKHALDYLTHYDRLLPHTYVGHTTPETVNPLQGLSGFPGTFTTFPIPAPNSFNTPVPGQPTTSFNALPAGEREMTLYGGTITNIVYGTQGDLGVADSSTQILITFTPTSANAVLAWGGHIGSRNDWGFVGGVPRSAGGISGSPYHMRLKAWDNVTAPPCLSNLGNQDRSLSADAVVPPPTCDVTGPAPVCTTSQNVYTATTDILTATYLWTLVGNTSGASIVGSATASTVTVQAGANAGAYTIQVAISANGFTSTCSETVTVNPGPTCSISATTPIVAGQTATFAGPLGMTTYAWTVAYNGGAAAPVGGNTQTVDINVPAITGTVTVGLTITSLGCTSSCSQTFNITPPSGCVVGVNLPSCPGSTQQFDLGVVPAPGSTILWTVSPNCAMITPLGANNGTSVNVTSATCCEFTLTVVITPPAGAPTTCSTPGSFVDTTPPVIAAPPGPVTVQCLGDIPPAGNLSATDNCFGNLVATPTDGQPVGPACNYTITRTWNVSDPCGNAATPVTQVITVHDTTAPVIEAAPGPVTVQCIGDIPPAGNLSATNNCGGPPLVATPTDGLPDGTACNYTITRTWNVSDSCGNAATPVTQVITVHDTTAPVIEAAPGPVTVQCVGDIPPAGPLSATDNCQGVLSATSTDGLPQGSVPCNYTITRTWNVSDSCGNAAAPVTQLITVHDTMAPVIAPAPDPVTVQCVGDIPPAGPLSATDNCQGVLSATSTDGLPQGSVPCNYTITRTWNVSDSCGNAATPVTQVITVHDTMAPVIAPAPDPVTVQCVGDIPPAGPLSATDNCQGVLSATSTDGLPQGSVPCNYTITRTWNVSDSCGNAAAPVTQLITVHDTMAPVIAPAPDPVTVQCVGDIPPAGPLSATDNCQGVLSATSTDGLPDGTACNYTITRTWNVSDSCGNAATPVTQLITVHDTMAPVINAAPGPVTVQCVGDIPPALPLSATDNCQGVLSATSTDGLPQGSVPCNYTITRTWNVSDSCGNAATPVTQVITVHDTMAPVIAPAPDPVTVQCVGDIPPAGPLSATDNCQGILSATSTDGLPQGSVPCNYTITRTWNVSDSCGNAATPVTQVITVHDTMAPVINAAPGPVTVQCVGDIPPALPLSATDNCQGILSATPLDGQPVGSVPCNYTITRTWNVSDSCGNAATPVTQLITVHDTMAPVINAAPGPVTVQCVGDIPPALPLSATDNCQGILSATPLDGQPVGSVPCNYTITRTWNVSDSCGNAATPVTQLITVHDTMAPVINAAPGPVTVQCVGDIPPAGPLSATDNCQGILSATSTDGLPQGSVPCNYTITRTWNVSDSCGNAATPVTQLITVHDTMAPVIAPAPGPVTVQCVGDIPPAGPLSATDNCQGILSATPLDGQPVGSVPCNYTITRTWNVSDSCGNAATPVTQLITVHDTMAPVIAPAPGPVTVQCVGDIPPAGPLSATDNCQGLLSATSTDGLPQGSVPCNYTITRTWNVSDSCGNAATPVTQLITVHDTMAPVINAAPGPVTVQCVGDIPPALPLSATDNCQGLLSATPTDGLPQGSVPCNYTITRTWNVSDSCGNAATPVTQLITVHDTMAPVINAAPGPVTVQCVGDIPPALPLSATDNCQGILSATPLDGQPVGSVPCNYTITRTWNVSDSCGNAATPVTQLITVHDTMAPVINAAPGPVTVQCVGDIPPALPLSATDNCQGILSATPLDGQPVGSVPCNYTITRTWNVSDSCGNAATPVTQLITVHDTMAPVINAAPGPVTVQCVGDIPPALPLSATDNCQGILSATPLDGQPVGSVPCNYTITRTWNVSDSCGNAAAPVTQLITVHDTMGPVIAAAPGPVTVQCTSQIPPAGNLSATDNCGGAPLVATPTDGLPQGSVPCNYTILRTWNVNDACGNPAAPVTQLITVHDTTPPVITCPANTTVTCTGDTGLATATDNCGALVTPTYTDVTVPANPAPNYPYTITRTWSATDGCNPPSTCTQTIRVLPCGVVTNSSLCIYNMDCDGIAGDRDFRLTFTQQPQNWPCYKVTSTNPGQTFYNAFHVGTPGPVTFTFTIPYPYVTQGANPLHAYDGVEFTDTCFTPSTTGLPVTLLPGSATMPVLLTSYGAQTISEANVVTIIASVTVPASGFVYLNMHLDYGLKGYGGYGKDPLTNAATDGGCAIDPQAAPIADHHEYKFTQTSPGSFTDSIYNCNNFKRNPGVGGISLTNLNSLINPPLGPVAGCTVKLKRNSNNVIVGTSATDGDGVYMINYKHTGQQAPYTVMCFLPGNTTNTPNFQQIITMQANKFYEASFPNCP